jgi:23S rRNA (adenine1618-N6)-methyltransferase
MKTRQKTELHIRNKHRNGYDLKALSEILPAFNNFIIKNKFGIETIDFTNQEAVKMLNKALLLKDYKLKTWDIPNGYLCPPIPGRVDYLHYLADLLSLSNNGKIPMGKNIKGLDIGTGANCIYPLLGNSEYGWSFVGAEIDQEAVNSANTLIINNNLSSFIRISEQQLKNGIFDGIINESDCFDFTICNPPFHASEAEAEEGSVRKWKNLGYREKKQKILNFGGQHKELFTKGGEETFIRNMINQSVNYKKKCFWFSTLVSKQINLPQIYKQLEKAGVNEHKTIQMAQGQKVSRFVAWTYLNKVEKEKWVISRWKN